MSQNKQRKHTQKRQRRNSRWIPILVALGGVLLVVFAYIGLRDKPITGTIEEDGLPPSLQVDKEQVDLGDVKLNQPVEVSFQITNTGEGPLRITKEPYIEVKEGC